MSWLVVLLPLLIGPYAPWMAEASGGPGTHVVEIRNFAFSPAHLEVAVGDTVKWINRDAPPHTATDSTARWDSGELGTGGDWTHVVRAPGRIPYLCAYHPSMRGELIVRGSAGSPGPNLNPKER